MGLKPVKLPHLMKQFKTGTNVSLTGGVAELPPVPSTADVPALSSTAAVVNNPTVLPVVDIKEASTYKAVATLLATNAYTDVAIVWNDGPFPDTNYKYSKCIATISDTSLLAVNRLVITEVTGTKTAAGVTLRVTNTGTGLLAIFNFVLHATAMRETAP